MISKDIKISAVFTTYNSPVWLQKVLWGFHYQTDDNFEIIIADDGSGEDTRALVDDFRQQTHRPVQHIWQQDEGFQKCRILNKAIVAATGDYLVFTDGDCIPRNDFIAVHRQQAEEGRFLSGGYLKLPMNISELITQNDIQEGRCFDTRWLKQHQMPPTKGLMKLTPRPRWGSFLNRLTPTRPSWNGHNASCFKSDALRVNGYDARLRYGGLDREFGERLENAGVQGKQIRYSAVVVHLDHKRGYESEEGWQINRDIRQRVKEQKIIRTEYGINLI